MVSFPIQVISFWLSEINLLRFPKRADTDRKCNRVGWTLCHFSVSHYRSWTRPAVVLVDFPPYKKLDRWVDTISEITLWLLHREILITIIHSSVFFLHVFSHFSASSENSWLSLGPHLLCLDKNIVQPVLLYCLSCFFNTAPHSIRLSPI